jgi:hypothetical protein
MTFFLICQLVQNLKLINPNNIVIQNVFILRNGCRLEVAQERREASKKENDDRISRQIKK